MKISTDDRPGNMNDVYENEEMRGKIIKYYDKYKTLLIQDLNSKRAVNITYGTFKRQWRKTNDAK